MDQLDIWMTAARDDDDQEGFARVVEACHHTIRAAVLRDTADAELADEIAQEALVRGWTRRSQYRPGTSPRAWLLAIARSQLTEHYRRHGRDRRHLRGLIRHELMRHHPQDRTDEVRERRLEALRLCVSQLDESQRDLLAMVHDQDLTCEAAAEILDIKAPACRQRVSRLQRALRSCAEKRLQESS
jgi:RNA polymerase sigma-70 factor, ECF subfamily